MTSSLFAMHLLAAQRGEGLLKEFLRPPESSPSFVMDALAFKTAPVCLPKEQEAVVQPDGRGKDRPE